MSVSIRLKNIINLSLGFVETSVAWFLPANDFTRSLDMDCKLTKEWRKWLKTKSID